MLPYWLFKHCCYALAPIVSHNFNLSFSIDRPPKAWNHAIISVPKVSPPRTVSDLRPISVVLLLSRLCKRYVVKHYLLPVLRKVDITDQFAFRPTVSSTAALVYIMHHMTILLETNDYVRCLLVDFSKEFDTVSHVLLIRKLQKLDIPPFVINWIINFLTDRTQAVIIDGKR